MLPANIIGSMVSLVLDRVVVLDKSELSAKGLTIKDKGWVSIEKHSCSP